MKTKPTTDLAYWLSVFIGPLSGPFVFKAAALPDFPTLQFSHYLIIICYVFGAIALSQILLRKLLRTFGGPGVRPDASTQAPLGGTPSHTP
ncbi:hypothetical protein [Prosthecobacter sp.]|uniref:hypothetical protein n=1 Tax=Prosthecobacter sp. TaxID=1965333 RepID=UPI003783EA9E